MMSCKENCRWQTSMKRKGQTRAYWRPLLILLLTTQPVVGEQSVATLVEVEGTVEIGRNGSWMKAERGSKANVLDEIRSGSQGRFVAIFQDNSFVNGGHDAHFVISEQEFDQGRGVSRSSLRLIKGSLRTVLSEVSQSPGSVHQIETATARTSGGSAYIITYNPLARLADSKATEIVGVSNEGVRVQSLNDDDIKTSVLVRAQELTIVIKAKSPENPQPLPEKRFRQYIEGFDFIGATQPETLSTPLLAGISVPREDRVEGLSEPIGLYFSHEDRREYDDPTGPPGQPHFPIGDEFGGAGIRF